MKVTVWYSSLILFIMILILAFIWATAGQVVTLNLQNQLKETVQDNIEELNDRNGHLTPHHEFEFFDDGVSISIYSENGQFLDGRTPTEFDPTTTFKENDIQTVTSNNQEWIVYDYLYEVNDGQKVWVRGVMEIERVTQMINAILLVSLIAFPLLILLAAVGGYFITKRAFRPVQKMMDSVSEIKEGKDLSKRIHLSGPHDEIHQLADTFNQMFDRLEKAFENEKQFTSDASHELRTPTSVIISQCELALSQKNNPQEMEESLHVILKQSQKMSSLISQLLMLARADHNNNYLIFEPIDLSELTEMIIEELTEMAAEETIEITSDIEPNLIIEADQTLMMRLLMNLITNAIAYGKAGGFIHIQLKNDGNFITGEIKDNGIGIEQKHLNKVWDRFFRVDPSRTSSASGHTGLGLSMAKWIVETHKGTITAESEYGKGSTFIFHLPKKRTK